jgi:hypothetical protein
MRCSFSRSRRTFSPRRKAEANIGRVLGDILRQMLLRFEPDALELRTEAYVDFLIFGPLRLDGFKPPGVDGKHRVAFDFVDAQSVIAHQSQRRFQHVLHRRLKSAQTDRDDISEVRC